MRDYRGEFEVHVTAAAADPPALARFRDWCRARGVKCVRIVLARGDHADQPMATWRRGGTTLPAVAAEARALAGELAGLGVPVARVKVEAAPGNDGVPQADEDAGPHDPANYFEHHAKLLRPADAPRGALLRLCEAAGAHLSRNAFRDAPRGREERFVTLRGYGVGRAASAARFARLLAALAAAGETVVDAESEYCVYDSNLALDAGWLPTPEPPQVP